MAKNDENSVWGGILTVGAIVGGAFLIAELVKLVGKEVSVYKCPNCMSKVEYREEKCHTCGVDLKWKV